MIQNSTEKIHLALGLKKTRANESLGKHGIMSNFKSLLFP